MDFGRKIFSAPNTQNYSSSEEEEDEYDESSDEEEEIKTGSPRVEYKTYNKAIFKEGGDVYSFGYNFFGQLGHGTQDPIPIPKKIDGLTNIIQISCGEAHSIAVSSTGQTFSWGCNRYGQLGHGDWATRTSPQLISALRATKVIQASCGLHHSALLSTNHEVFTFGCGSYGRLGHGDHKHVNIPKAVAALRGKTIIQVSCGGWFTFCISSVGVTFSWGCNRDGQLSQSKNPLLLLPRNVTSFFGTQILRVECGKNHTLLYTEDGELYAFGQGTCGQLGNGSKKNQSSPILLDGFPKNKIASIACGIQHSVAITTSGSVYIWGYVSADQLGLPEQGEEYLVSPVVVDTSHI